MATLHIIEGAKAGSQNLTALPVHAFPASGIPHSTLTTSSASASHTFNSKESLITLISTGNVHIQIGTGSVTATTSDLLVPAYTIFSFKLDYDDSAQTMILAAIDAV